MRKSLLGLTLMVSAFFMLGTTPASAANCSVGAGAMQARLPGVLPPPWGATYPINFAGCTGVNGVQVAHSVNGTQFTGWYDGTWVAWSGTEICFSLTNPSCGTWNDPKYLYAASSYSFVSYRTFYANAWHSIAQTFWWRIRNSNGSTWGPYNFYIGPTINAYV